jgi:hypothetical protein
LFWGTHGVLGSAPVLPLASLVLLEETYMTEVAYGHQVRCLNILCLERGGGEVVAQ